MENEIIILECQGCGANLRVVKRSNYVKCEYCGKSHKVPLLLESYSLCPICNKDDKVEKASGVVSFTSDDFHVPSFEHLSENVGASQKMWIDLLTIVPVVFLVGSIINKIIIDANVPSLCIGINIFLLICGIFMNYSSKNEKKLAHKKNAENSRRLDEALSNNRNEFNRLKPVFDNLYYCHRDKIIFLPSSNDYASIEELKKYLKKRV
jgi:hypothetical protein